MFTGSKKLLLDIIKRQGSDTLDNITARTDLSKTTLREHLLQLERDGYIRRTFLRSGPGRPKLSYELTTSGQQLFPSSEGELLRGLLNYLKSEGNETMIEHFFESFWNDRLDRARKLMRNVNGDDIRDKITALSTMLEEEGFMPEFEITTADRTDSENKSGALPASENSETPGKKTCHTVKIRECNCPFSQAIRETRLPCKLEAKFYELLFQHKMERTSYIADGEHACTYEFDITAEN